MIWIKNEEQTLSPGVFIVQQQQRRETYTKSSLIIYPSFKFTFISFFYFAVELMLLLLL